MRRARFVLSSDDCERNSHHFCGYARARIDGDSRARRQCAPEKGGEAKMNDERRRHLFPRRRRAREINDTETLPHTRACKRALFCLRVMVMPLRCARRPLAVAVVNTNCAYERQSNAQKSPTKKKRPSRQSSTIASSRRKLAAVGRPILRKRLSVKRARSASYKPHASSNAWRSSLALRMRADAPDLSSARRDCSKNANFAYRRCSSNICRHLSGGGERARELPPSSPPPPLLLLLLLPLLLLPPQALMTRNTMRARARALAFEPRAAHTLVIGKLLPLDFTLADGEEAPPLWRDANGGGDGEHRETLLRARRPPARQR